MLQNIHLNRPFNIYLGAEFEFKYRSKTDGVRFTAFLKVLDTVRVKHFETQTDPDLTYSDHYEYFMYGDGGKVYLSHIITKKPDFQQVNHTFSEPSHHYIMIPA